MKPQRSAVARIFYALLYSKEGLLAAVRSEAAFRQELVLYALLLPLLFLLPFTGEQRVLLLLVNTLVLIVELINSAIEALADLVSPGPHELVKKAKDIGSAAVFLALLLAAGVWCWCLYQMG
jgi:diacylglycerol kinase (ATP)